MGSSVAIVAAVSGVMRALILWADRRGQRRHERRMARIERARVEAGKATCNGGDNGDDNIPVGD